ncbi:hypothetical protein FA95DRAFT_1348745 [Auriscalpium vulgare]|uniref:Uncharacterized protein n=1 Tax=Auriscalpium vulgare TaxID=40419 RepID=A0ACB8RRM4_9AGAM|nr:hypothetical protein FA95DRAFT_1348745 [Auriscalpium vulgare]
MPCPILETLDITFYRALPTVPPVPGILLDNAAPALRKLRLTITITSAPILSVPSLTNLISLDLTYEPDVFGFRIPWPYDIVAGLRRLPRLEVLKLNISPFFMASVPSWTMDDLLETVQLPRLMHISLIASLGDAQCLLERLEIPSTATLQAHLSFYQRGHGTPALLFSVLRRFLHGSDASSSPITKLGISVRELQPDHFDLPSNDAIKVVAWRGAQRQYLPPVSLTVMWPHGSNGEVASNAVAAFASEDLAELVLLDAPWDEAAWTTALWHAPCIESIEVAGSAAVMLCAALANSEPGTYGSLAALKLRNVDFDDSLRSGPAGLCNDTTSARPRLGDVLPAWLEAGVSHLKILDLRRCGPVCHEILSQLRTALPNADIVAPYTDPGGPRSLRWGSSVSGDCASKRLLEGRSGGILLLCAGAESDLVVLDEVQVNDESELPPVDEVMEKWKELL